MTWSWIKTAWIMGLLVLALGACHADAVSCGQAIAILLPCEDYFVGQSARLTAPCCQAASSLNRMVRDKPDLRNLCGCLKQAAAGLHIIVDRAKTLPQKCHIQVPVPIDPNVDCSRTETVAGDMEMDGNKNVDVNTFRPTTPGHSPGIGNRKIPSPATV